MTLDPALLAVVSAIVTLAGIFYRHLLKQISEEKADKLFWRDRALHLQALAEIATEEAEKANQ